jgi:phosphoribosylamine---glycine ligase
LKILVTGGGAREHTLVWKLAQSPQTDKIYAAPGNAGTALIAENLPVKADDIPALAAKVQALGIDMVMVGPEAPLAAGIVDRFDDLGIPVFGPTARAAAIETSKVFAKELFLKYGIPTGQSQTFTDFTAAADYVKGQSTPIVIKADGLAAGKGVIIAANQAEAQAALHDIMEKRVFGDAGARVLVEEFMEGPEVSVFAACDGEHVLPLGAACDYKRAYDNDEGLNTGGMGCFSPPRIVDAAFLEEINRTVMEPTVKAMAAEGRPYRGILFAGLMLTKTGPKVLEFNARFGDPETQVILPRLKTDLVDIISAGITGRLDTTGVTWHDAACVGVVMASGGYPSAYPTGLPISGLDSVDGDVNVFHAGTISGKDGEIVTAGGRVLTVTALGADLAAARQKVYDNIRRIGFEGSHYRRDIAKSGGNR